MTGPTRSHVATRSSGGMPSKHGDFAFGMEFKASFNSVKVIGASSLDFCSSEKVGRFKF